MTIKIMSRKNIEDFCLNPIRQQTAVISITDFENTFVKLKNEPQFLLQLMFDDVPVGDGFVEEEGRKLTQEEISEFEKRYHSITDEQAKEIVEFYNSIKDSAELLICQCEYGQSRSAAVAAAIMEYQSKNGIEIFSNDWYYPNKSLFRKVLRHLNG